MGWLEPADRLMHSKPHKCDKPILRPDRENDLQPGDRWQCDECENIWVYTWTMVHSELKGVKPRPAYDWLVESTVNTLAEQGITW